MPQRITSPALEEAVKRLAKMPGIGKKAAMRMAVYLLETAPEEVDALAEAIKSAVDSGMKVATTETHDSYEVEGVNTLEQLATLEAIQSERLLRK